MSSGIPEGFASFKPKAFALTQAKCDPHTTVTVGMKSRRQEQPQLGDAAVHTPQRTHNSNMQGPQDLPDTSSAAPAAVMARGSGELTPSYDMTHSSTCQWKGNNGSVGLDTGNGKGCE